MAGMLAITAAAGWLLAFLLCAVVTRLPPRWAGPTAPWPGLGGARAALVNLVVTRGRLNGAAYPATILDLAAQGHLMITQRMPGQLWCDVPAATSADTGLAQSERLALADASQLAGQGGAPFEAVAESCASDVRGKWDPFEEAVRSEGRQAGLTRPRLPVAVQAPLYVSAGIVSLLVFRAVDAVPHTGGVVAPLVAALFAFIIPVTMVGSLGQKDRPTSHGAAVGAWAAREAADAAAGCRHLGPVPVSSPAELSALALAVAAGAPTPVPGVSPGLAAGVRPGRATARSAQSARTPRPSVAWSSVGGQWRLVGIGPVRSGGIHPAAWLGLVALLAFLAFGTSLWPGPAGLLLQVLLAAAAAVVGVFAVRRLGAWLAMPAEASFQGQVIARWIERHGNNDSDWDVSCIAVDDGERSWSFYVKDAAFAKLTLGEAVAVRAAPRSGELLSLVPLRDGAAAPGQPAPDLMADEPFLRVAPGSSNPLLTEQEVSAVVGRPVEATGFQLGMLGAIYRGADLTVSLTVTRGGMGRLSYGPARQWGRALPGIGDEAWQVAATGRWCSGWAATPARSPSPAPRRGEWRRTCRPGWPPPWPPAWPAGRRGLPPAPLRRERPASHRDPSPTHRKPSPSRVGLSASRQEPPASRARGRTRRPRPVRPADRNPPSVHLLLTFLPWQMDGLSHRCPHRGWPGHRTVRRPNCQLTRSRSRRPACGRWRLAGVRW